MVYQRHCIIPFDVFNFDGPCLFRSFYMLHFTLSLKSLIFGQQKLSKQAVCFNHSLLSTTQTISFYLKQTTYGQ